MMGIDHSSLEGALAKYWRVFFFELEGALSDRTKQMLVHHPILMRITAQAFKFREMPRDLATLEIFDRYYSRIVSSGRDSRGLVRRNVLQEAGLHIIQEADG